MLCKAERQNYAEAREGRDTRSRLRNGRCLLLELERRGDECLDKKKVERRTDEMEDAGGQKTKTRRRVFE